MTLPGPARAVPRITSLKFTVSRISMFGASADTSVAYKCQPAATPSSCHRPDPARAPHAGKAGRRTRPKCGGGKAKAHSHGKLLTAGSRFTTYDGVPCCAGHKSARARSSAEIPPVCPFPRCPCSAPPPLPAAVDGFQSSASPVLCAVRCPTTSRTPSRSRSLLLSQALEPRRSARAMGPRAARVGGCHTSYMWALSLCISVVLPLPAMPATIAHTGR